MNYQPVIGLEIHCELLTASKVFCACDTRFGAEENTQVCPRCAGLPGALPSLNRKAVEYTIRAGLALGCKIAPYTRWDRKNYFYPDLPKAYQISQLHLPLCIGGGVKVGERFIRLNRIHLEEDAGKLVHDDINGLSLADYNRGAVPLIEIVTEPDLRNAEEAAAFVEQVRLTLVYAGVSDGRMEQGSLRVDANISIMPAGSDVFGTRVEIKNLNSVKSVVRAIEYEIKRQAELLDRGGTVTQETRRFNDNHGKTTPLRSKEDAQDYRYFPDPDIPPLLVGEEDVQRIRGELPELPAEKLARYTQTLGLSEQDAVTLIDRKIAAEFFDRVAEGFSDAKAAANLVVGELLRRINLAEQEYETLPVSPEDFIKVLKLAQTGELTQAGLKTAVRFMFEEQKSADVVLREQNLIIKEDLDTVKRVVAEILEANPKALEQWRGGDKKVFGFFMGECNKRLKGQASPQSLRTELERALSDA